MQIAQSVRSKLIAAAAAAGIEIAAIESIKFSDRPEVRNGRRLKASHCYARRGGSRKQNKAAANVSILFVTFLGTNCNCSSQLSLQSPQVVVPEEFWSHDFGAFVRGTCYPRLRNAIQIIVAFELRLESAAEKARCRQREASGRKQNKVPLISQTITW